VAAVLANGHVFVLVLAGTGNGLRLAAPGRVLQRVVHSVHLLARRRQPETVELGLGERLALLLIEVTGYGVYSGVRRT